MKQGNIGKWKVTVETDGKAPQIIVIGSFPTKGEKPGYHLKKKLKTDNDKELSLILVFGSLIDEQGSVYLSASYTETMSTTDQYKSVLIYDDKDEPRLLANVSIADYTISAVEDAYEFDPYLEIIKGIEVSKGFLKIRVPSGGLTDSESFGIYIDKGFTSQPPYLLGIYRIKPDFGKAHLPEGTELKFSLKDLGVDSFSTFTLINTIG